MRRCVVDKKAEMHRFDGDGTARELSSSDYRAFLSLRFPLFLSDPVRATLR